MLAANGADMKRAVLAIIFVLVPVLAMAGLPQNEFAWNSGEPIGIDTVNPMLFNAVQRTVALELRCRTECFSNPLAPSAD